MGAHDVDKGPLHRRRGVTGCGISGNGSTLRYPRSLNEGVLREIAAMKDRTENEIVKSGEINRNVKLGRGGIREIEFVAQTPSIAARRARPLSTGPPDAAHVAKSSCNTISWSRSREAREGLPVSPRVEHRVQMESNLQTHTIPSEEKARERLARLMGFKSAAGFEKRGPHTRATCARYMSDF